MEVIVIGFIIIIIIGALFGGESFGGVIITGIIVIASGSFIVSAVHDYKEETKKEEYKIKEKESEEKKKLIEQLSTEEKKSTDTNFIYFTNKCNNKITLHIHYLNNNGIWETRGAWEFDENEGANLVSSDSRLTTNNSILFYHIDGDNISFNGNYKFSKYGDTYYMKKVIDRYDTTEFSYSCK